MGHEERDLGEHEAVWECPGEEWRAECGGTLAFRSEDHVEGQGEEDDGVNAEEEAFGTYAMDYRRAYNRMVDPLRDTVIL